MSSSGSKTYDLLRRSAIQHRIAAEVFNRLAHAKGDQGLMAKFAVSLFGLAEEMDQHAIAVKPSSAMRTFEKGQAKAMENWRPGPPGRPS